MCNMKAPIAPEFIYSKGATCVYSRRPCPVAYLFYNGTRVAVNPTSEGRPDTHEGRVADWHSAMPQWYAYLALQPEETDISAIQSQPAAP
jgi:hypothetical protein